MPEIGPRGRSDPWDLPDELQRGDRGARCRGLADPARLGRRSRDRCDADRPCRRPARADADRRGRKGRAGACRPDDAGD